MKHASGPWVATAADHPEQGVYGCGYRVAKMTSGELQRDRANARLIAAAPDLLEALRDLSHHCDAAFAHWPDLKRQVEAALAKAGGQP